MSLNHLKKIVMKHSRLGKIDKTKLNIITLEDTKGEITP